MKCIATIKFDINMDKDRYDKAKDADLNSICDKIDDLKAELRQYAAEFSARSFDSADAIDIDDHY